MELRALLSKESEIVLVDEDLRRAEATLNHKISSFLLQANDFLPIELLGKEQAFRVLKRILNFGRQKLELARLNTTVF